MFGYMWVCVCVFVCRVHTHNHILCRLCGQIGWEMEMWFLSRKEIKLDQCACTTQKHRDRDRHTNTHTYIVKCEYVPSVCNQLKNVRETFSAFQFPDSACFLEPWLFSLRLINGCFFRFFVCVCFCLTCSFCLSVSVSLSRTHIYSLQ